MSGLDDLEEIAARFESDHGKNSAKRIRAGQRLAELILTKCHKNTIRKLAKDARQRKVPITLAGPKS